TRARLDAVAANPELVALTRSCLAPSAEARPHDARVVAEAMAAHRTGVQERLRAAELARVEALARAEAGRGRRRLIAGPAAPVRLAVAIGAGSWMAFRLDRDARIAAADRLVGDALGRAEALRDEAERTGSEDLVAWSRALAAAEKAREALAGRPA